MNKVYSLILILLIVILAISSYFFIKEIADNLSRKVYEKFEFKLFENKELKRIDGISKKLDSTAIQKIYKNFMQNEYIDDDDKITGKLHEDIANDVVAVPDEFKEFKDEYSTLIKSLFTDIKVPIENAGKENIRGLKPNKNFASKEFQELWNKINIKTHYQVDFDSQELIDKAINRLNRDLKISKMRVRVTQGEQKDSISAEEVREDEALYEAKANVDVYDDFVPVTTKYDLIGSIVKDTGLTRKTIIAILSKINAEVFGQYKYNPEEFIRRACNLINEEKATTVIDGIVYDKTNEKYSNDIFTINNISGRLGENAIEVKKAIYDYVVTDSAKEIDFAKDLENGEAIVYAKLPSGFKIPTPLGSYNPDWAIVFDKDKFKYVYFIAETKGSMSTLQLKGAELGKIECARKHFKAISDGTIKYDVVDSYQSLIDILTQV